MKKVNVILDATASHNDDLTLCPDANLYTGKKEFKELFGKLSSLEEDILNLAAIIFGTDLAIKRGEQEKITRNIEITIPVVNLPTFRQVSDDISYALYILSHDAWKLNFVQSPGFPEPINNWKTKNSGKVLLFSGGLDSFAAAVNFADSGHELHLVSHVTANQVISKTQQNLYSYLNQIYPNQFSRDTFRVSGIDKSNKGLKFPSDKEREETQRTRSFLFLSLASLVARRRGIQDVVMIAENGQMAIHLPLSAGRISAFSTHTAHPDFIALMSKIMSTILNYQIIIENPFLYKTKAEVVKFLFPTHELIIDQTVSCWKASRVSKYNHCGICVPCLIRRIALEKNNCSINEYAKDLFRENVLELRSDDDGKRNLIELCEFINTFSQNRSLTEMEKFYPELVSEHFDAKQTVAMYQRFSTEAISVFQNYPQVMKLLE